MLSFNLPTGPDHLSPPTRPSVRKKRGLTDGASGPQRVRSWFFHSPPSITFNGSSVPPALTNKNTFPALTLFMEDPTDQDERSTALQNSRQKCPCMRFLSFLSNDRVKQYHTSKSVIFPKLIAIANMILIS